MPRSDNIYELPKDLPVPVDDGACDHLPGMQVASVRLESTAGRVVDLAALPGRTVVYCYPRTGRPDVELPAGWNEIPGARGCTPESCAFRDYFGELEALGAGVFGLSTQESDYQREAVKRLHLPFELLSDSDLAFARGESNEAGRAAAPAGERVAFAALRHRDYRIYFSFGLLSTMADNIEHVISYWLLYQTFKSPLLGGFAVISHWTPFLLFSVYFGALADRYDCRKIIQAGQLLYMGGSIIWGVLFLTGAI